MPSDDAARFWDSQAETFDDEPDHGLRDPTVRSAWRDLLAEVLPAPPAEIADLGCGTGSVAVLLAELGHRVVGVDLSAVMVEAAKAKAVTHNVPGARFFVGNASDPDLASNSLDAIVVRHVMWTLPDVPRAIERWTRCLRAGGVLVMVEGRWSTGTGITAERLGEQVRPMLRDVVVRPLPDPRLWGGSMVDERYMVVGRH